MKNESREPEGTNTEEVAAQMQVAVAVGAELLSCAHCKKKGCDRKSSVSAGREGGTSASQFVFYQCWGFPAAPSGLGAEMARREQVYCVNTNPAWGY